MKTTHSTTSLLSRTAMALTLGLTGIAMMPTPASAAAPMIKVQAPGFYRVMLGDFQITALSDGTDDQPVDKLLSEPATRTNAMLRQSFLKSPLETSVNAFLINTGSRLILVDTGAGAWFGPTLGKLVANLRAAGYEPGQVDDILLTHMHPDHEGGLVADDHRVFPNATVHASARDADFWLSKANMAKATANSVDEPKSFFQDAIASLKPYVEAGKVQWFDHDAEILPGVSSISDPGHTVGHTAYLVQSKGQKLLLIGDAIVFGAVQFENPSVTVGYDMNPNAAIASRAKLFAEAVDAGDLVGGAHVSFPGLGHITRQGQGWDWIPVNYTTELH
jgi:glyoxylase-like metal-dependent hydrolase (beta-lactamase superfamily II)